jgi:hypothetical protein
MGRAERVVLLATVLGLSSLARAEEAPGWNTGAPGAASVGDDAGAPPPGRDATPPTTSPRPKSKKRVQRASAATSSSSASSRVASASPSPAEDSPSSWSRAGRIALAVAAGLALGAAIGVGVGFLLGFANLGCALLVALVPLLGIVSSVFLRPTHSVAPL